MGVVSNNLFDRVFTQLLTIYTINIFMLTDAQAPFIGNPLVPLKPWTSLVPRMAQSRVLSTETSVGVPNFNNEQLPDKHSRSFMVSEASQQV